MFVYFDGIVKEGRGNRGMKYTGQLILLGSFLLLGWGCAQKSAKLQKSVVPPDQTLFETGTDFLKKGQYIRSRLALQNMISTYPDSEMLADAYFAVGDTYFEEGGTQNWLQAEQQYNDFITFFPADPKAPDAQMKKIALNRKMVGAPDRDQTQTKNGEREAMKFLEMYPDHDFAPIVRNELNFFRDNLALYELGVSNFYARRKNYAASIGRLKTIMDDYPDFYKTPEVLFKMADYLEKTNNPDEAEIYLDKLVSAYPFSDYFDDAKQRLVAMGKPVPDVNTVIAEANQSKMKSPEGFSLLTPLNDFVGALGFKGPPDIYKEATEALAERKKKEAEVAAAQKASEKEEGIDIKSTIRK